MADAPRPDALRPPRPPPPVRRDLWPRLRAACFSSTASTLATLALLALAAWAAPGLWRWGVAEAVWRPDADACQAAHGVGACWGVIAEKGRLILFGRYPFDQQWRAAAATAVLIGLLGLSGLRACWRAWLPLAWLLGLGAGALLMRGGAFGLPLVETDRWGGLPLTLLLTVLSVASAFPLALAVALGRRSALPLVRALCATYVELVRGVPLVSVLFMASFLFPLFMPAGLQIDVLLRVLAGMTLFAAAYVAEVIRGGLQAVPRGQIEAAAALGLGVWRTQLRIVLPQALAAVVPGLVNHVIALFKDTSLVTIVSLYELTGAMSLALNSDSLWRPFKIEAYLFIAAIYFAGCTAASRYGAWVERRLQRTAPTTDPAA
ncbi:amino acid ABC transporter permease [Pseudaquabacterium rugosum]|uniref:Amino acid ABC transporter permease n=1 Tax=Pseudaquabacterium rugosum TaxID=2984194 RepID=A0ABU9B6Y0_9BURK